MVGPRGAFVSLGAPCSHRPSIFRVVWFLGRVENVVEGEGKADFGHRRPWATSIGHLLEGPQRICPLCISADFFF
jgi:hypothetical protein